MHRFNKGYLCPLIGVTIALGMGAASIAQELFPAGKDTPTRAAFLKMVQNEELRSPGEYAKHTKDPRELHERAKAFLTLGIRMKLGLPVELSREKMHQMGVKLMEDGSTDPLVIALTVAAGSDYTEYKQIAANCAKAMKDVVEIYEPCQQVVVIQWCQNTELALSQALWEMRRRKQTQYKHKRSSYDLFYDAHVRWLEAESDSLDRQRYMWHIMTEFYHNPRAYHGHGLNEVAKRGREKKVHPWMRHMLDGFALVHEAAPLFQQGDDAYRPLWDKAAKEYLAAWKLAPQFPEAACQLITMARNGHVEGTPRLWFDRTVAVEFDHPKAYTNYRMQLRSEGTDSLIAFGQQAAATRRFDTKVPFELLECLWAAENQTGENAWARPGVYESVRDLCQRAREAETYMGDPQTDHTRKWAVAIQIAVAARASRFEEIARLWDSTDIANLERAARVYKVDTPLPSLKAAADAAVGGAGALVNEIEQSLAVIRDPEGVAAAEQKIHQAAKKLDANDRRLALWRASIATYKNFFAGNWADITFPAEFIESAGAPKWSRVDDRTLATRGTYRLPLELVARLPAPLELELDISTIEMPSDVPLAGVQFGLQQPAMDGTGIGSFFGVNSKTQKAGVGTYGIGYQPAPVEEKSQVRILAWHGYRQFFVNGERVTSDAWYEFDPTRYFALWAPGGETSTPIARFGNLRIRPIPYSRPPGRKTPEARIAYFTERIEAEPKQLYHFVDRGDTYLLTDQPAEAVADYEHVLKARPGWDYVILQMGAAHDAAGEYQQAIDSYQEVLKITPAESEAWDRLAWLEATCDDERFRNGAKAVEHAQTAVKSRDRIGNSGAYKLTAAVAYAEVGDFKKAREFYAKARKEMGLNAALVLLDPVKKALDEERPFRGSEAREAFLKARAGRNSLDGRIIRFPANP